MEELEQILQTVEFENNGWIKLMRLEQLNETLLLDVEINTGSEDHDHQNWRICCTKPHDFHIERELIYDVEVVRDHVLLWKNYQPSTSLFIKGRIEDYRSVIGALYEKHIEVTGGWYSFGDFDLSDQASRVLAAGFGLLARGPSTLVQAYAAILEKYGFDVSMLKHGLPEYHELGGYDYNDELLVLLLGNSYVVAQGFSAENTTHHAA